MIRTDVRGTDALPIHAVIFSRDRAMQLDAALASFSQHCAEAERVRIDVLYAATSPPFAKQYELVESSWRRMLRLKLHRERDFRADLLRILGADSRPSRVSPHHCTSLLRFLLQDTLSRGVSTSGPPYVLFLVDDNIFYRPFSLVSATKALEARPRAIGFSLRLGRNTTYCYALDSRQQTPHLSAVGDGVLAFDWTTAQCDFGYPLEVSSSVYRAPQMIRMLARLNFSNPNALEGQLAGTARRFWSHRAPELLCLEQSVAFCNAVNKVQTVCDNRSGTKVELSALELARRFESGLRIDIHAFAGFTPDACHCTVPFSFIRDEARTTSTVREELT